MSLEFLQSPIVLLFAFPALLWGIATVYSLVALVLRLFPTVSTRRVGGLRFVKVGRVCLSFCVARSAVPFA